MAGNLNVVWIHGSPHCATATDPPIQVHTFDDTTFILRQSKCSEPGTAAQPAPSFEAPFLYLNASSTGDNGPTTRTTARSLAGR
jgi:hydroxyacylglutathione hydrolase